MKRIQKLLAALVPPVVAGVAPACELNVLEVFEKTADETVISRAVADENKADSNKEDFDNRAVEKGAREILAVLPIQATDRSKWLTKDELAKKLPKLKPAFLDKALGLLKGDREIEVFKDESGTLRYARSYSDNDVDEASKEILAVLATQPVDRSKWVTKSDLTKKLPKIKSELLDEALDWLKEDDKIIVVKSGSDIERYGKRNTRHG